MVRGVFITLEGGEGTGKSTQLRMLAEELDSAGFSVLVLREPGGTEVGEVVRKVLLDPVNDGLDARSELLLYEASRAQLVAKVIGPALASGRVVLCDRFYDSTTAYQGYGRELGLDDVRQLNEFATGGLTPDLTIVLDLDPAEGLTRATYAGTDRLEAEEAEFHVRVRKGFLAIAAEEPERVVVIDASVDVETVALEVRRAVMTLPVIAAMLPKDAE